MPLKIMIIISHALNQDIKRWREKGLSGFNLSFLSPSLRRRAAFQQPSSELPQLPPKTRLQPKQFTLPAVAGVGWLVFFQSLRDANTQVGGTGRSFPWHLQLLSQPACPGMAHRGLFKRHLVQKHLCSTGQLCAGEEGGRKDEKDRGCVLGQARPTRHPLGLPHSPDNTPRIWQAPLPVHHGHNLPCPPLLAIFLSPELRSRRATGDTTAVY